MNNLRDKFESDDDYNDFKKAFEYYKKQNEFKYNAELNGRKFITLINENFIKGNSKYFIIPEDIIGKNMGVYVFNLQKVFGKDSILIITLN